MRRSSSPIHRVCAALHMPCAELPSALALALLVTPAPDRQGAGDGRRSPRGDNLTSHSVQALSVDAEDYRCHDSLQRIMGLACGILYAPTKKGDAALPQLDDATLARILVICTKSIGPLASTRLGLAVLSSLSEILTISPSTVQLRPLTSSAKAASPSP